MIFPWAGFAWVSGLACGLFLLRLVEGVVVGFAYTFFLVVAFSLGVGFSFPGVVSLYVCGFLSLGFFCWLSGLLFCCFPGGFLVAGSFLGFGCFLLFWGFSSWRLVLLGFLSGLFLGWFCFFAFVSVFWVIWFFILVIPLPTGK